MLPVGGGPIDQQLEFVGLSVNVDNPTNQWLRLDSLGITVPQYTLGAIYPLPGTTRAQGSFTAPPGQVEPPTIAGQSATLTFYSIHLPVSAGVGMLGGRAPYYDRNPLSIVKAYDQTVGPHALTSRWAYTVPAGRRAYLEEAQAITELQTAYTGSGNIESLLQFSPVGVASQFVMSARIAIGTVIGARADIVIAVSMEMQPGDIIQGMTSDPRVGGTSLHYVTAKITEFDV